jgi:hypothetical protein
MSDSDQVQKENSDETETEVGSLGYGVDLFQADPWLPKYKSRILAEPIISERHLLRATGYREIYADSFLQLSHTLAVEAGLKGSYGDFSGSVDSKFSRSEKRTEKRHIQKISFTVSGNSHALKSTRAGLKKMLDNDFKAALATADVGELFRDYGTHVAYKITTGGRAEYYCETSDISSMTAQEFKVAARAKYKSAGGKIEGHQSTETTDSRKEKLVSGSASIATIGGSAKASVNLKTGGWAKWAESCETSPAFLGFDEDDGLVPIWELTDDAARRAAIRDAYQRIAAKRFTVHITSETSDVASRPTARVTVPKGYKLLSGGARNNWTARGSFLTASFPDVAASGGSPGAWEVRGKDHLGDSDGVSTHHSHYFPEKTSVTAFAIAIYDPDDIWEVKTVYFDDPAAKPEEQSGQSLGLDGSLTANGFVMVGGGARANYSGKGSLLIQIEPEGEGSYSATSRSHLESDPAKISTYLIALRSKVKGIRLETKVTRNDSGTAKQPITTVKAASGYTMTGGGAYIYGGSTYGLLLTSSYPKDGETWEARGKDHGEADTGKVLARAIGLKVIDG